MLPVTSLLRSVSGPRLWENFEYIYMRAKLWNDRHGEGNYPKRTPHAEVPPFRMPDPVDGSIATHL
jgi:hypothetical protein